MWSFYRLVSSAICILKLLKVLSFLTPNNSLYVFYIISYQSIHLFVTPWQQGVCHKKEIPSGRLHKLISCEFITSVLLCRFVSQNSRHSHWHSQYELWISYAFHVSAAVCILCALSVTHSHSHSHEFRIKETHTHTHTHTYTHCTCDWNMHVLLLKRNARGARGRPGEAAGVPSPESAHANNQSMRWPAVESIRIYLQLTYLRLQVAQTNMRHALRLPFASCLMAHASCFWRFARHLKLIGATSLQLSGPTSCPSVINWNATFVG